jgi:IS30 family transposase
MEQHAKPVFLTLEERRKFQALYESGMPTTKIAAELGIHYTTAYRELKRGTTGADENGIPLYDAEIAEKEFRKILSKRSSYPRPRKPKPEPKRRYRKCAKESA